jgi:hypothetical protein
LKMCLSVPIERDRSAADDPIRNNPVKCCGCRVSVVSESDGLDSLPHMMAVIDALSAQAAVEVAIEPIYR